MRFPLVLLALLAFALPAFAQDEKDTPTPKDAAAPAENQKEEEPKPKVNWVEVESTGLIGTGKEGAFDKTLWKDQNRSDIEFLIEKMPTQPALRSVLSLERRLLITRADAGLIKNDILPLRGNDLLIQRINKLMDLGLHDDAWELYTQKAEEPYDVSIAQLGMTLMIMRNDLSTACLEEKVFAARFPKDKFFNTLDRACAQTLGSSAKPTFPDNAVLQSVYNDAGYSVSAATFAVLANMGPLERSLVLANGKIRYNGLTGDILSKTPSELVVLYLWDKSIPENAAAMVRAELLKRGLAIYNSSVFKDGQVKKIRDMKNPDERWPLIESVLNDPLRSSADFKHIATYIVEAKPANLSTASVIKVLNVLLAANRELPSFWLEEAQKRQPEKPIISIYLQAFKSFTPTKIPSLKADQVQKALLGLKPEHTDQIIAIIDSLDKESELAKNSLKAYDKHLGLTLENNYVMPSVGLNILLETAPDQKQVGITVLAATNSLAANPDLMYSGSVRKALYSMLNVGLLEDAKAVGSEITASVLNKY